MAKIAILFPGNLDSYKISIKDVKKCLIEPNDADVFIISSKNAYIRMVGEDFNGGLHSIILNDSDKDKIYTELGNRVKVFKWTEDISDYEEQMNKQIQHLWEVTKWVKPERRFMQYYDPEKGTIGKPRFYIDRFLKMRNLYKLFTQYCKENNITYDIIVRSRLDFNYNLVVKIPEIDYVQNEMAWDFNDAMWASNPKIAEYYMTNLVNKIGSYDGGTINDIGDYRLDRNYQVKSFLKEIPFKVTFKNWIIPIGCTLFRGEEKIFIENYPKTELKNNDRQQRGKTLGEYYGITKIPKIEYPILDKKFQYIFTYTYHSERNLVLP